MEKIFDTKNIVAIILSLLAITAAATYKYFDASQENYFLALIDTYQSVAKIKNNLQNAADNFNVQNSEQNNFLQVVEVSREILSNENKKLSQLDVPEKYSDANKKIIECLTTEYNLLDRLKENFSIQNEYAAADNFPKSKELFTNLQEQSAFLNVERNNFEEIFDLSPVSEKVEKFLNTKKQLRYDKDQKEQAEREKIAKEEEFRKKYPLGYYWIQDKNTGIFMQNPHPVDGEEITWSGGYVWKNGYKLAQGHGITTWTRY